MPAPSIGPEFSVKHSPTGDTPGNQLFATVAATVDGRFSIAWHDFESNRYLVRPFDAQGVPLESFNYELFTSGAVTDIGNRIELAGLPGNELVAVYIKPSDGSIDYTRFVLNGTRGPEFGTDGRVSIGQSEKGLFVSASALGTFWVGTGDLNASSGYDNHTYEFSGDTEVNEGLLVAPGDQDQIEGVADRFEAVVVFRDVATGNVYIDSPVADNVVGTGTNPHIAKLEGAEFPTRFAVTWEGPTGEILVRIFDSNADAVTGAISVMPGFFGLSQPHVCALQDGRFLVVWNDEDLAPIGFASENYIYGRLFNADGTADSDAFVIDSFASDQPMATSAPRAAQLADGRIVVTYSEGLASNSDVKFRILDPRTEGVAIAGSSFDDDHIGTGFDDAFVGGAGHDRIAAGGGADQLFGGTGFDNLKGGMGADLLNGGAGGDSADYTDEFGAVRVNLATGQGQWNAAEGDTLVGIESVFGTDFGDVLTGNSGENTLGGFDGDDFLHGGLGGDGLFGGAGIDTADYADDFGAVNVSLTTGQGQFNAAHGDRLSEIENVIGTEFNDQLTGNAGVNRLEGRGGADTLHGGLGADTLIGGAGIDTADYTANFGAVRIDLATGKGRWNAAEGDALSTIENVTGTSHNDVLIGNELANILRGGVGADTLAGNGGVDTADYTGNFGAVQVNLATGVGRWNAAEGDVLSAIENVTGTSFNDVLIGDGFANTLAGGLGNDTLTGAGGADNYLFNTALGASNVDAISGYSVADDTIQIDDAVFAQAGAPGTLASSRFHTGAAATTADHRIIYNNANGALSYDADGNGGGAAIQFATLTAGLALTNADFVVV